MNALPTPLVSVDWLADNLKHPDLVLLDATLNKPGGVAPPVEKELQIPGARFFDIKQTFSDTSSEFPNTLPAPEAFERAARELGINQNSLIVVYDAWGIYSSPRAWWMFRIMGHEQVSVLDGGLPAWQAAGQPCTTDKVSFPDKGNFKASFQPALIKYTEDIADNLQKKDQLVLDARSAGRFNATVPEPRAGLRGGHIPGSKNLPIAQVLKEGKLKSKEELTTIFQQLNAENQEIICSCGSGITASVIYLAAHVAGQPQLSLYDGSWTEYALNLDLPAEK